MFAKNIAAVVLIAAASSSGIALAAPAAQPPPNCILAKHRVANVQPLRVTERYGRGSSQRLAGAQIFVQAEPGLTAEWLQLTIQRHMAEMSGKMANCALDAKDIRVNVVSGGSGFAVQITGKNSAQGEEILRRAQLLVR